MLQTESRLFGVVGFQAYSFGLHRSAGIYGRRLQCSRKETSNHAQAQCSGKKAAKTKKHRAVARNAAATLKLKQGQS